MSAVPQSLPGAPAADVDSHGHVIREAQAVDRGEMNQPRLLGASDDSRPDPGLFEDLLQECATILGFPHRARGHGLDVLHLMRLGKPAELRQHLQRILHGARCQRPAVQAAGAQAQDRADIDRTPIIGNRELPKVLIIVPWKKPMPGDLAGRPLVSVLDEALAPLDRDVFRREVRYDAMTRPAAPAAAAATK